MAVMHAYFCPTCDAVFPDRWSDDVPVCCGKAARVLLHRVNTNEWGAPRSYPHLRDEPFGSRSELDSWAAKNGLALGPQSEKVGGARNEEHLNTGRIYSHG